MDERDEEQEEQAAPAPKPRGPLTTAALAGAVIFVAVLGAQIAAPPLNTMLYGEPAAGASGAQPTLEPPVTAAVTPAPPPPPPVDLPPAIYVPLDPALVVSLGEANGEQHFIQLNVQAMTRNQKRVDDIKTHAPALRDAFLLLVSKQTFSDITTAAGKESLRNEMLADAQEIMRQNTGESGIEALYFTSFVVQ